MKTYVDYLFKTNIWFKYVQHILNIWLQGTGFIEILKFIAKWLLCMFNICLSPSYVKQPFTYFTNIYLQHMFNIRGKKHMFIVFKRMLCYSKHMLNIFCHFTCVYMYCLMKKRYEDLFLLNKYFPRASGSMIFLGE